jgi:hypothetical protein
MLSIMLSELGELVKVLVSDPSSRTDRVRVYRSVLAESTV